MAEPVRKVVGNLLILGEQFEPELEEIIIVDDVLFPFCFGVSLGKCRQRNRDLAILGVVIVDGFRKGFLRVSCHREDTEQGLRAGVGFIFEEIFVFGLDGSFEQRL